MVEVEALDTTLDEVLKRVEQGDEVRIIKSGEPVASMFPVRSREQRDEAFAAMARMDERAKRLGLKFDLEEFKADKEFGRR